MASQPGQELAKAITLGVFDFAAEKRGRKFVRLVADDEIEAAVRRTQLLLHILIAGELVEPGDDEVVFEKPIACTSSFELVIGENFKGQMKTTMEFVLPLFGETARANNEAPLEIAAGNEFLDEQPGHNRLAGARIVSQQKPQWLAREHCFVNRGDLVRQRVDQRCVDREDGVEEMREANPLCLGNQSKKRAISIEAPGATGRNDLESRLIVAIKELVPDASARVFIRQLESLRTEPLRIDSVHQRVGEDASNRRSRGNFFEAAHSFTPR